MRPIVTFTSDFGHQDWFVGVVHGVVLGIAPEAHVVDLNHAVPSGDIARAAFVVEAAAPDFPPGTVHLAVVDPGVGTARRAIAVRAQGQTFVAPDNGLLEGPLGHAGALVHELRDAKFFRHPVSRTFHGRDVFAPVAAHLANGTPIEALGPPVADPVRLPRPVPTMTGGELHGHIVFVDRFGNALTDLTVERIAAALGDTAGETLEIQLFSRVIRGLAHSYGDADVGTLVAVLGSSGRLEIAQVGGHAAERLGIGEGDPVIVRRVRP